MTTAELNDEFDNARDETGGYVTDEARLADVQCRIGLGILERLDRLIELADRPTVINVPGHLSQARAEQIREAWVGGGPVLIPVVSGTEGREWTEP